MLAGKDKIKKSVDSSGVNERLEGYIMYAWKLHKLSIGHSMMETAS